MVKTNYAVLLVLVAVAAAQNDGANPTRPQFLSHAKVERSGGTVTVVANAPRPLDQAIIAVRQEYGWTVSYEDPPYGPNDVVDNTDPGWREAHPNASGVTRVGGKDFTAAFHLESNNAAPAEEEGMLREVVTSYNKSANPGKFMVIKEGPDRYSVVGIAAKDSEGNEKSVTPILDTPVTIPVAERSLAETIQVILRAVSDKSGQKVALGGAPVNLVFRSKIRLGGDGEPARELLTRSAAATRFPLVWRLLYSPDMRAYFMNFELTTQMRTDPAGRATPQPIRKR